MPVIRTSKTVTDHSVMYDYGINDLSYVVVAGVTLINTYSNGAAGIFTSFGDYASLFNYGVLRATGPQGIAVGFEQGVSRYIGNFAGAVIYGTSLAIDIRARGDERSTDRLDNMGTIEATGTAISYFGDGAHPISELKITNSGAISGTTSISADGGSVELVNSGRITGTVNLGSSADIIVNTGLIDGDIHLGDGADTFDQRRTGDGTVGSITGMVFGGSGDDRYLIDAEVAIVEMAGEGTDEIVSGMMSVNLGRYMNVENAGLIGSLSLDLIGDLAANTLTGNDGINVLRGLGGDDIYRVQNIEDQVIEARDAGVDLVVASVSYVLSANVENLTLLGTSGGTATGNDLANHLTGDTSGNVLIGGAGADTLIGGGGLDFASYATAQRGVHASLADPGSNTGDAANDSYAGIAGLIGSSFADVLTGSAVSDRLDGGIGADRLIGGNGNDIYTIDDRADRAIETQTGGDVDIVQASISWRLGANLEILHLIGDSAIDGTGNALANGIIGNNARNVLAGARGDDVLQGGGGSDLFIYHEGDGNDFIADFAAGSGAGHDRVRIDTSVFADFDTLMAHAVEQVSGGHSSVTITIDATNSITLDGIVKQDLVAVDFSFG